MTPPGAPKNRPLALETHCLQRPTRSFETVDAYCNTLPRNVRVPTKLKALTGASSEPASGAGRRFSTVPRAVDLAHEERPGRLRRSNPRGDEGGLEEHRPRRKYSE